DGTAAQLAYAHLDWAPLALLGGTLEIDALTARGLHLTLPPPSADEAEAPRALALPFAVRADNVALEDIRITRAGAAPFAIGAIELERTIDSERARIERLRVAAPRFDVRAHGSIGLEPDTEGTLTTDWRVEPPGQPAVAGAGEVRGNLARLVIEQRVSAPVPARVRAQVQDALGDMTWSAEASVPEFPAGALGLDDIDARAALSLSASGTRERFRAEGDVRALLPALPPIAGRFELRGESEGPIALEQLVLVPEDAPARLTARGQWQPGDGRWQAHLAWERLQWPLRGEPLLRSPEGTLEASGTRAQYRLAPPARAPAPPLPPPPAPARGPRPGGPPPGDAAGGARPCRGCDRRRHLALRLGAGRRVADPTRLGKPALAVRARPARSQPAGHARGERQSRALYARGAGGDPSRPDAPGTR